MAFSDQSGLQVKKLTIKPGLVVDIMIITVQKSINTGHTFSNTACVDCDCDIQICESDFQRTLNQPVMVQAVCRKKEQQEVQQL